MLKLKGEEKIAIEILQKSLEEPIRKIAENAGKDGAVISAEVKKLSFNEGYNALEDKFEDFMETGIVDPAKVVRSCVENAVSAASMLLTTECIVVEKPEEKKDIVNDRQEMGY
jgi:chaperonin GroEL